MGNKSRGVKFNNSEKTQDKLLATEFGDVNMTSRGEDEDGESVRITLDFHRGDMVSGMGD
jgi:hypothetical protein